MLQTASLLYERCSSLFLGTRSVIVSAWFSEELIDEVFVVSMFFHQGLSSLGGLIGGRGIFQRRVHSCVHGDVVTLTLGQVLECFQLRLASVFCPLFVILRSV